MHMPVTPALARALVVIELIGDLDAELVTIVEERLAASGTDDIAIDLAHVARYEPSGILALARTAAARRLAGRSFGIVAPNRTLRSRLVAAGTVCEITLGDRSRPSRHVMLARHAPAH